MVATQITVSGLDFLTCVYYASWPAALMALDRTGMYETLRLLDQIDRTDLAELMKLSARTPRAVDLPRVQYAAEVVLSRKLPSNKPATLVSSFEAETFLAFRAPLIITQDPTWTLPPPLTAERTLTTAAYATGAALLGAETAAVQAVATVESGGRTGFMQDGRCKVRYELHKFSDYSNRAYSATHPHLSNTYTAGKDKAFHIGNSDEWSHLYGAAMLRRTNEAILATSWGMFQIMGFNHAVLGYATPGAFAFAMTSSAGNQLDAFLKLCQTNNWSRYLVKKDWAGFAAHFNGPSYHDNKYDEQLANAYARFSTAGK